jgi:hypothetical protein
MTRQQAIALIQYLSRAHGIIPTNGAEWEVIREALTVLENVANGKGIITYTGNELEKSKPDLKSV